MSLVKLDDQPLAPYVNGQALITLLKSREAQWRGQVSRLDIEGEKLMIDFAWMAYMSVGARVPDAMRQYAIIIPAAVIRLDARVLSFQMPAFNNRVNLYPYGHPSNVSLATLLRG